jgi:hypothetical protein
MNQVDGCCQHGELLNKYCPECDKEDREAEKKEFNPQEGDRILVGLTKDRIDCERIYIHTDRRGTFVCVEDGFEKLYLDNAKNYRAISFPYAKPMPQKLPEFIQGDPVVVWIYGNRNAKWLRIVHSVSEDGSIKCFHTGTIYDPESRPIPYSCYKPLPNYDYGGRDVWGSEDKK